MSALNLAELSQHVKTKASLLTTTDVDNTKLGFDSQLSSKQNTITGAATSILNSPNLTENKVLVSSNTGKIDVSNCDASKLEYLSGLTSNIQTQIDTKQNNTITGAAENLVDNNLLANRVLVTNNTGKIIESHITADELNCLENVTSNIKTQIDNLTTKSNKLNNIFINSGSLKRWIAPTGIASITSQSSLTNHILVMNKETTQRLTLTSVDPLHSSSYTTLIQSLQVTVDGVTTTLNLANSGIVINTDNKTIDFNYTASSLAEHIFTLKLKDTNLVYTSTTYTTLTISVLSSAIFEYPTLGTTSKNSPHDTADVTVGQSISMTSAFSSSLPNGMSATIVISDGSTNPSVSSSISGGNLNYSFTVSNDSDHSASIILNLGSTSSSSYSWSAAGLLTAANDIYTFPNSVSYDGTINGYDAGKHLKQDTPSTLVITITGGDKLHSTTYTEQVSEITYKTGLSGPLVYPTSSDVSIDISTETITISNVTVTAVNDIYFTVKLIAPDGAIIDTDLSFTISNTQVEDIFKPCNWAWPAGNNSTPAHIVNQTLGISADNFYSSSFRNAILSLIDHNCYYLGRVNPQNSDYPVTPGYTYETHGFISHDLTNWNPPTSVVLPYRDTQEHNKQFRVHSIDGMYYMGGFAHMADNYWQGYFGQYFSEDGMASRSVAPTRQRDGVNEPAGPWHIPFAFSSEGTISRIWVQLPTITSRRNNILTYNPNPQWKITGFTNRTDMYNVTNGIVMLEISGHSWCDQWQTLTTPATVSHIRVEQTNTRTLPGGTEYYTGIRFGQ